jgi:nicotinamide phosphoribosyltransferase
MDNLILMTDSYKSSHFLQYPPHTDGMFSYLESRGGKFPATVFFGLQYIVQQYLSKPVTKADIDEAEELFLAHGEPFPRAGWDRILEKYDGYIPVRIKAVKEGSVVPTHNVLMTVESTDPETFWVVNWIEALLHRVWYPITVATSSYFTKQLIMKYLSESSDAPDAEIPFKLHDFGGRGVSSHESAGIGGAAHLVNFMGTDTVEAIALLRRHYGATMPGFSIPAAEHSTITSWGRDGEREAFANMVKQFAKPGKLFAVVSDSYDLWKAVEYWAYHSKDIAQTGATLVIRPDSGDPAEVCLKVLQQLDSKIGLLPNNKGYKVLPPHLRVIQGDGVNYDSIGEILKTITMAGYSASNLAFGMGGALLQKVDRDVQKFAYKCSSVTIDGMDHDVFKDPVTDPGKKSKRGKQDLISDGKGGYATVSGQMGVLSLLETVYENGRIFRTQTLDEIRAISNKAR